VQSALLPGVVLILIALTGWMKLISYAHANKDVREILKAGEKPDMPQHAEHVEYPDYLTIRNIAYFMFAPTLCYQLSYPRTEAVRKGWVLRQLGKLVVFLGLIGFIIEQYINPTVSKSQPPLKGNYLYAAERILKLSMPVLYVWLCMFYCLFHLWLNIVAELLRFGDREFYKDWWNAKTVEEYWRMWNMPVHKWMVRHIYFPSIRAGLPKFWGFLGH
jgi:diacylglycerol O-acyltransferase-1